jgi:hypothetical protein
MDPKQQIAEAFKTALAEFPNLADVHDALAGRLNEAGMIVKQLSVVRFGDGSHVVFVSNDGEGISVEISP